MRLVRVIIESIEPEHSYFQVWWSPATHIGVAIDTVLTACVRLGLNNPIAREAAYVDSLPANAVRKRQLKIWYAPRRDYFPSEKGFVAPGGIIASSKEGEYDYDQIREGFSLSKTDEGIFEVEAAIERDKLFDTYVETKSARVQREMAASLKRLGFNELPEFHGLEHGYYHWHYRPTRSKSRTRLIAALKNWGFKLWKAHPVARNV